MARNKEALVLLIDVGPSMHWVLPEVERLCFAIAQKKLIFHKADDVGVVVFGTEETNNELKNEVGGYEHVTVLRNLKVVDGDIIEAVQNLPRGTISGDFIDAIVVGIDMQIKKFGQTSKGKKRLCLITNAENPIKEPFDGTKEDQIATISSQMAHFGVKMHCIVIRQQPTGAVRERKSHENDLLLNLFSLKSQSKVVHVDSPISLLGAIKTRNISPVTIFRGDFELSPDMKIKVWVYKKTSEERLPTLKKYSDKAPPTDKFATHEVKVDFEYKCEENPDQVVPPERRIKGYRYGPQVIPVSSAEWDAGKFKPEKSVKLLGVTDASNVMRQYYMRDVYSFIPEPKNEKSILAVSALARSMKEMNKVAIIRCVWRNGQGNVVIGVLTPNLATEANAVDSFYFNVLPFAEDVREFQFPSLSSLPSSCQPTDFQQEAVDKFVLMLDLAPAQGQEVLQPELTPNPSLERFYRFLDLKSKQPDSGVPPLDNCLKKIIEPDPGFLARNGSMIENICQSFELKENPKKKSSRRTLKDKPSTSNVQEIGFDVGTSSITTSTSNELPAVKVEKIGNINAIKDFEAMMSRRDSSEWVGRAIVGMQQYIDDILRDSTDRDVYHEAIECLRVLRKGCVIEQETKSYNQFLSNLYDKWKMSGRHGFFDLLRDENVTLISKAEAEDSDVMEEEARIFPAKRQPFDSAVKSEPSFLLL